MNLKNINITAALMIAIFCSAAVSNAAGDEKTGDEQLTTPELPAGCAAIEVPAGNKVNFRVYAVGVQIYRWNGTAWSFVAPLANLYAAPNFRGKVGTHYGGPTWESNSGSTVVGARVDGCTPDMASVPWLLLRSVETDGPGIFSRVTYIQRVATNGGIAPANPGTAVGQEAHVPYTTEYYFYRAEQ